MMSYGSTDDNSRPAAADQPVKNRSQDRLARVMFAEAIARAIAGWRIPESLVVSLMGPWGAGKTSIKNFVVDAFTDIPEQSRPEVLDFNPWQITDRENLAAAFFRDVGLKLGRGAGGKNKDIAKRWNRWAAALEMTGSLADLFPKDLTIAAFLAGFTSIALGRLTNSEWVFWLGVALSVAAAVITTSARAARAVAKMFAEFDELSGKTLDELRESLKRELASRDTSLLIMIDDIDRLPPAEIKLIFQLVRAVSDFPRLIFLLIFERVTVERALTEPGQTSGHEYLEKIVQMPFFVPKIDQPRLQQVLLEEINFTLTKLPASVKFDDRRWWNLFVGGVNAYVDDLRDVYRYATGFGFHAGLFKSDDVLEVNPVDLLGLETLRLFEPELYVRLTEHQNLLLQGPGQAFSGSDNRAAAMAELEELLKFARKPNAAKQILATLFQQIEWLTNNYAYGQGFEAQWQRELRICSSEIFDRYMILAIPSGDISTAEIQRLIKESSDLDGFRRHLVELNSRGQLFTAIDRLSIHENEIPPENIGNVVQAVLDVGDDVPERAPQTGLPAVWFVEGFASRLLKRIGDADQRKQVLCDAMEQTTGIYLPSFLLSAESAPPEEGTRSTPLLPQEVWPSIRQIWRGKLRAAAASDRLLAQPHLAEVLFTWLEIDDPVVVQKWVSTVAETPSGAVGLIDALTVRVRTQGLGDASAQTRLQAKLETIERLVSVEELENQIALVDIEKLTKEQRRSINAFRRAVRARREGRSSDRLWREDTGDE